MDPKFIGGKHKKQTKAEPVYDQTKDLKAVIFQIVEDLKEQTNEELRSRLAVSWKELQWLNAKMGGNVLELRITIADGSLRMPQRHPQELQKKSKESLDVLGRVESAIRKEFKKRTGKALTWVNPKEATDYQLVALNGLYNFYAIKVGEVKTVLAGQSFDRE